MSNPGDKKILSLALVALAVAFFAKSRANGDVEGRGRRAPARRAPPRPVRRAPIRPRAAPARPPAPQAAPEPREPLNAPAAAEQSPPDDGGGDEGDEG